MTLGHALDALPQLDELQGLRDRLLESGASARPQAEADATSYQPIDRRPAELGALRGSIPELVERQRDRHERILTLSAESLHLLARGDETGAAFRLISAGEVEEGAWRLEQAEAFYGKALELARRPRDRGAEGLALRRVARVARTRGDLLAALRLYTEAWEVCEARRDAEGAATSCLGAGNVHVDRGEWEAAREWYLRGMDQPGDRPPAELLHFCNGLSVVERRLGHFDASEQWLQRGEAAAAQAGDADARHYLEHGRARLLLARGEVDESIGRLQHLLEEELDPTARISALINLAEALLEARRDGAAEDALRRAEELALRYRAHRLLPHVYELLGTLAGARGDADGFVFFEQALDLIREHALPPAQAAAVQLAYGRFEARMGHEETAAALLELAADHYRSVGALADAAQADEALRNAFGHPRESGSSPVPRSEQRDPAAAPPGGSTTDSIEEGKNES